MAWSDPAQAGLLGYERIAADGTRALVCRTISAYGVLGEAIPVADTTAPQFGAFLPTLLALEGTQTFLMVWYTSTGVEARILDTGCNQFWDSALEVPG